MKKLCVVSCADPAVASCQMSRANPFEGRGRSRGAQRRAHGRVIPAPGAQATGHEPDLYRAAFSDRWARLVRSCFRSRDRCARELGVTFQTACNWFDGASRPTGDKVALVALDYPEDFAAIMGDAA